MSRPGPGFRIDLQYRLSREADPSPPLSHPLVSLLRAVRDGGSIQGASRILGVSYRYAWGALRRAEKELDCELLRWVQGEGSVLTARGHAMVHAEDLALSRLAPQIEALRSELARAFDAALGPQTPTLTMFASHDVALPALRELAQTQGLQLDLRFLGSVDSLRALAAGRCLVAGFHAPLDAPVGSGYARQLKPLLQPGLHKLIGFALRTQGLIVPAHNPRNLGSVADLATAPGLRFVSRQPGSGTRLLIDALLEQAGLDPQALGGSDQQEDSHLAVAAAVACGVADAGIGIESAARAFGLDFVPLARERYAFVCLKPSLEDPAVRALRHVLDSAAWRNRLAALPGYAEDGGGQVLRLTQALPWWNEVVGAPRRRLVGAG
jgi:molybdate transport repressor ModE-like protein